MLVKYRPLNQTEARSIFQVMLEEQFKRPEVNKVPTASLRKMQIVSSNGAIVTL